MIEDLPKVSKQEADRFENSLPFVERLAKSTNVMCEENSPLVAFSNIFVENLFRLCGQRIGLQAEQMSLLESKSLLGSIVFPQTACGEIGSAIVLNYGLLQEVRGYSFPEIKLERIADLLNKRFPDPSSSCEFALERVVPDIRRFNPGLLEYQEGRANIARFNTGYLTKELPEQIARSLEEEVRKSALAAQAFTSYLIAMRLSNGA